MMRIVKHNETFMGVICINCRGDSHNFWAGYNTMINPMDYLTNGTDVPSGRIIGKISLNSLSKLEHCCGDHV